MDPDRVEAAQADLLTHAQDVVVHASCRWRRTIWSRSIDPDTVDQTLEQQLAAQERKALASAWFTGQFGADGIARGRFALPNLTFGMLTKHLEAHTSPSRVATGPAPTRPLTQRPTPALRTCRTATASARPCVS